jgi:hypothetical protein
MTVNSSTGQQNGGGSNTNGVYFQYMWDTSALPDGVCESIPTFIGGELCATTSDQFPNGSTVNLMLGPSDAIVFYGCTPPPVEYFGFDFIINARTNDTYPFYPGTNFQDAINFRNLNVSGPTPFQQPALIVHTADLSSFEAIQNAYANEQDGLVNINDTSLHALDSSTLRLNDRELGWKASGPDMTVMIYRV